MASRKSNDTTSQNGVSFAAGNPSLPNSKNVNYSQHISENSLQKSGAFNGHAVEIWADGAVWDTVSNKFLFPGTDYNPGDLQRK